MLHLVDIGSDMALFTACGVMAGNVDMVSIDRFAAFRGRRCRHCERIASREFPYLRPEPAIYFTTAPQQHIRDLGDGRYELELSSNETSALGPVAIPINNED